MEILKKEFGKMAKESNGLYLIKKEHKIKIFNKEIFEHFRG